MSLATTRQKRARDDAGATLILALIFLVVISLTVIGLVRWTGNDLSNTSKFVGAQSVQSAANSANQFAIQFVRYNFLETGLDSSTPASCWVTGTGAVSATSLNDQSVDSWCMTLWYPGISLSQRVVTISTCASTISALNCGLQPLLQSIVSITDGGSACFPVPNATSTPNTCGQKVAIADWQFGAAPPVVTSTANGSFTCTSGTPVTVTGQNFTFATEVDFLVKSSAGSTSPVMAPGTMASGSSSYNSPSTSTNTIQVCAPSVLTPNTFYVIVSTPLGSSEYGPSSLWT
jgi:hypothetical protein